MRTITNIQQDNYLVYSQKTAKLINLSFFNLNLYKEAVIYDKNYILKNYENNKYTTKNHTGELI